MDLSKQFIFYIIFTIIETNIWETTNTIKHHIFEQSGIKGFFNEVKFQKHRYLALQKRVPNNHRDHSKDWLLKMSEPFYFQGL